MNEMDRLADLKVALYPTDGPSEELRARALASVAGGAVPRSALPTSRRWVRPALVAAGVAVVAAGAVLLDGALGTSDVGDGEPFAVQPAAFTLQVNADGSVTFAAHDVIDTVAATQALNGAGIAGRVINDITPGCATKSDDIEPGDLYPDNTSPAGWAAARRSPFDRLTTLSPAACWSWSPRAVPTPAAGGRRTRSRSPSSPSTTPTRSRRASTSRTPGPARPSSTSTHARGMVANTARPCPRAVLIKSHASSPRPRAHMGAATG